MMYSITVESTFSSAHNLREYTGKCEELHGHNWKVEVVVSQDKLDKAGMVLDFKYLKMIGYLSFLLITIKSVYKRLLINYLKE